MIGKSSLRESVVKLVAGQPEELPVNGNYLRVSASVYGVIVEIDGNDYFRLAPGEDVVYPVDEQFSRVKVTTLAPVDDLVTVAVGRNVKMGSAKVSGAVSISGVASVSVSGNLQGIDNDLGIKARDFNVSRYFDLTNKVALSVTQLLSVAENVNGFDLRSIKAKLYNAGAGNYPDFQIVAKNVEPVGMQLGGVIACANFGNSTEAGTDLENIFLPAGLGLFVVQRFASNASVGLSYASMVGKLR